MNMSLNECIPLTKTKIQNICTSFDVIFSISFLGNFFPTSPLIFLIIWRHRNKSNTKVMYFGLRHSLYSFIIAVGTTFNVFSYDAKIFCNFIWIMKGNRFLINLEIFLIFQGGRRHWTLNYIGTQSCRKFV